MINDIRFKEKNITTIIQTIFFKKNKKYTNNIYINEGGMEKNINSENNIKYFTNIKYYALLPKPCKYIILILLEFNSKKFKSILYNIT